MKYDLSVLVPGIRPHNWLRLYNSVGESFIGSWEMIIISPYDLPPELGNFQNIKLIKDWGTPIRCQQIGLIASTGDYISWAADDGYYLPGALDIGFNLIRKEEIMSAVVTGKYHEGDNRENDAFMSKDEYYMIDTHRSSNLKSTKGKGYYLLNVGIAPRTLLIAYGGWDCQFEVCPMAYTDLAIRLQHGGVKFLIQEELMFKCGHMPMRTGDHGPIHDAQIEHDEPLLQKIYSRREYERNDFIDLDNWTKSPERWERRFGKDEKKV